MRRLLLAASLLLSSSLALAVSDVNILPLKGPVGTAKISPGNGSATAYRMDFSGQKSICFKMAAATDVYIASSSAIGTNGFPLFEIGESVCADLQPGTTVYFYGNGASADIRAFFAR